MVEKVDNIAAGLFRNRKPQPVAAKVGSLSTLIGRNRLLVLNIFKYLAFRRNVLALIGQISKKYYNFVKQDMAMFEMLEKEKKQNYIGSDQEFSEFMSECCAVPNKDFSIELYLRARYLPRFLSQCDQVRIKDFYVIFDNAQATQQTAHFLEQNIPQNKTLGQLRKLEFTHSPRPTDQEFYVVNQLLRQTTRNLNRIRVDHFQVMQCVNEVGLNSFIKLKKLRLEHLESDPRYDEAYATFLKALSTNTTLTFVKLERIFTRDVLKQEMLRDAMKTSRVKKMVLWLYKGPLEATDQLCQFLHCKRLQSIKVRRFDHKRTDLDLLQILIAINLHSSGLRELYLEEWDFSQDAVVTVINTYLSDLLWFSASLLTLRVNRESFEAFAWKLKNSHSVNHCVVEERSALEDIVTFSLFTRQDQNSPPEFQAEWITKIWSMQTAEGATLRKRLKCNVIRSGEGGETDASEPQQSVQQSPQPFFYSEQTVTYEYRLPILRLVTTGMRRSRRP